MNNDADGMSEGVRKELRKPAHAGAKKPGFFKRQANGYARDWKSIAEQAGFGSAADPDYHPTVRGGWKLICSLTRDIRCRIRNFHPQAGHRQDQDLIRSMYRDFDAVRAVWGFKEHQEARITRNMLLASVFDGFLVILGLWSWAYGLTNPNPHGLMFHPGSVTGCLFVSLFGYRGLIREYRRSIVKNRQFVSFGEWMGFSKPPGRV